LPHTTLLAVVERETGFVPPSIEALIRTKTTVGITNEVDVLGDRRAVDAHVAHFSALFTRHSGIDHFEMIEAQVLKLLRKKINLGGEHVHLFKLVNLVGAGLSALLIPALVGGHLLDQYMSFLNTEGEERTSNSSIYMLPGVTPRFSKRIEFYKFIYLNKYLIVAFHANAYLPWCCEVFSYYIVRVEIIQNLNLI
jgi:hypothetical protein